MSIGDILSVPADVLVCSANVFLNLSGGVGGAFLLRYGPEMQAALHKYLRQHRVQHVPRGSVVCMPPCGSPYRAVLHAVAVDAAYESEPEVVESVVRESLINASKHDAKLVALPALATGYGKLSIHDFALGIQPLVTMEFPPIEKVVIAVRSPDDAALIASSLGIPL